MPTSMTFASLQQDLQNYLERGTNLDPIVFAQLPELINFAERRISKEMKVLGFVVAATFTMQANLAVYPKPDRWRKIISFNVGAQKTQPVSFPITSVTNNGSTATYVGVFPLSIQTGKWFTISGFVNPGNNGTFVCTSSSPFALTLANTGAINESATATATLVSTVGPLQRQQIFDRDYEYIRSYWPDDTQTNFSTYGTYSPPKFWAHYNYQNVIVAPTPDLNYSAEIVYYEEPALLDNTNTTNFITQYMPNLLLYAALLECTPFLKNDARIATWQSMYDRAAAVYDSESKQGILDRNSTRQET
jgi:hypothetical protein